MDYLPVSERTISALKARGGALLKEIEQRGKVKLSVSKENIVEFDGEPGDVWASQEVVKAVNYGFAPQRAFKLFSDTFYVEVLDLKSILHSEKARERYKGRIIGTQGKALKAIEELSDAFLSVSGDKVAILGEFEDLQAAKEAVNRLLEGAQHSGVYAFLEKRQRIKRYSLK